MFLSISKLKKTLIFQGWSSGHQVSPPQQDSHHDQPRPLGVHTDPSHIGKVQLLRVQTRLGREMLRLQGCQEREGSGHRQQRQGSPGMEPGGDSEAGRDSDGTQGRHQRRQGEGL